MQNYTPEQLALLMGVLKDVIASNKQSKVAIVAEKKLKELIEQI